MTEEQVAEWLYPHLRVSLPHGNIPGTEAYDLPPRRPAAKVHFCLCSLVPAIIYRNDLISTKVDLTISFIPKKKSIFLTPL